MLFASGLPLYWKLLTEIDFSLPVFFPYVPHNIGQDSYNKTVKEGTSNGLSCPWTPASALDHMGVLFRSPSLNCLDHVISPFLDYSHPGWTPNNKSQPGVPLAVLLLPLISLLLVYLASPELISFLPLLSLILLGGGELENFICYQRLLKL